MKQEKLIKLVRMSIYVLIWTLLFLFPILTHNRNGSLNWNRVIGDWIRFVPFLLVFLIHHLALLPILIKRKNKTWYLLGSFFLILIISVLTPNLRFLNELIQDFSPPQIDPMRPPMDRPMNPPPRQLDLAPDRGLFQPVMFYNFIILTLLVGFDSAVSLASEWFRQVQKTKEIERNQLQTELAFLRNQVSPHFFMNTLNNIHALIEEDKSRAQDAVIRLSKLMRYLLYETGDQVPLHKEFEFISSYMDLMRMRYDEKVDIVLELPDQVPQKMIHPLLCISFIENAFKHGISYQSKSFVRVGVDLLKDHVEFRISNSHHQDGQVEELKSCRVENPESRVASPESQSSGIGLENARKQLSAIYDNSYKLDIRNEDDSFFVYLKIPLQND